MAAGLIEALVGLLDGDATLGSSVPGGWHFGLAPATDADGGDLPTPYGVIVPVSGVDAWEAGPDAPTTATDQVQLSIYAAGPAAALAAARVLRGVVDGAALSLDDGELLALSRTAHLAGRDDGRGPGEADLYFVHSTFTAVVVSPAP